MKTLLAVVLCLALSVPVFSKPASAHIISSKVEHDAVGAIFMTAAGKDRRFICSGSMIGSDSDGNGLFLTARHCLWNSESNIFYPNEQVSFSPDESGPFYDTKVYAISQMEDVAILKVVGAGKLPTEVLEVENLKAGDAVENVSFPLGLGKLEFHGRFVAPVFPHMPADILEAFPEWFHSMPVDITIAPGSSGSPLFDSKTHCIIGVMVGSTGAGTLMIAEPISSVLNLVSHIAESSLEAFKKAHPDKPEPVEIGIGDDN